MIGSERIRIKIRVCLSTQCLLRQSPEPAVQLSVKRRFSQSLHADPSTTFCPVAAEYEDLFVQKQFVIFASPLEHLFDVKVSVQTMYHKLYPEENPIDIKRLRDSHNCDLDDDFLVGDVFVGAKDDALMAICEYGVTVSGKVDLERPGKRAREEQELRQPLPVRVTDRCIATPLSTVDDLIRQEAEPLFQLQNQKPDDKKPSEQALASSESESESESELESGSEYETETESEESVIHEPAVAVATAVTVPAVPQPIEPVVAQTATAIEVPAVVTPNIANNAESESGSSEYETDSEEETETESESEEEEPMIAPVAPVETVKIDVKPVEQPKLVLKLSQPIPAVPVQPQAEESSEYETESESEESESSGDEDDKETGAVLTQKMVNPTTETQTIPNSPNISSDSSSSEDDSDFKPTALTEVAKRASVGSQPQLVLSQSSTNKKYGSHLFHK